ncbi:pancreatic lipase-related protein 2-like [Condylostylus longicornis]|uniref:pancreatic lipase-related protein 2-like n=1 Tax=Condylostylus longicornis TaxID=2530218 RepID=UPI00244E0276|nr:pancreatic lipase-related protein 2-like [Condylostylus longicornis]
MNKFYKYKMATPKIFVILLIICIDFVNSNNSGDYPLINNRAPRNSITIGPCTWVINRSCPDTDIKFYLFTRSNRHDRQFIHIDETKSKSNLSESFFNPRNPTKIIIHGYNSDMYLGPLISMKEEYLQIRDYNLFYVDWSILATGPCYFSAVHNTRHAGNCIGQLVQRILDEGSANIHLIGFSLGAHVPNYVAQNVGSFIIPRITGLDPAMPLFITASKDNKLDSSDAAFVDAFHTNAFVQGKIERCGHADFYMNGGIIQPGCENNPFACSHHRAADYYTESIRSVKNFWGWPCSSYISYLLGLCPPTNNLFEAGENCNTNTEGMFIVSTNGERPFAKGKWPEYIKKNLKNDPIVNSPYNLYNKRINQPMTIDEWGKLDYSFNNLESNHQVNYNPDFMGIYSQNYNEDETNEIADILRQNSDVELKLNLWKLRKISDTESDTKRDSLNDKIYNNNKNSNKINENIPENDFTVFGLPIINEH